MTQTASRVNKGRRTDAQYIKALERSNNTLSRENKRLILLRRKEQAQPRQMMSIDTLNGLVTMDELYERIPILATIWKPAKLYIVCHEKRIPHYKLKDRLLFSVSEVQNFLTGGITKITPNTTKR
jgi:hypothetical protein